jgi:hypothetical protein
LGDLLDLGLVGVLIDYNYPKEGWKNMRMGINWGVGVQGEIERGYWYGES